MTVLGAQGDAVVIERRLAEEVRLIAINPGASPTSIRVAPSIPSAGGIAERLGVGDASWTTSVDGSIEVALGRRAARVLELDRP